MSRLLRRVLPALVFGTAVAALAVSTGRGHAQPLNAEEFKKTIRVTGPARQRLNEMRDGKTQVLRSASDAQNKADLLMMAKSLIYPITDPAYYYAVEPTGKAATELKPVSPETTIESRFEDFRRFVLLPNAGSKFTLDQFDYINEFGNAVDLVLKDIIAAKDAPDYIRVNSARMLAEAAKSGAPAHLPMIIGILENPDTRPEVLVYGLQAAQGLLSAFDISKQGGIQYSAHTIKDPEMVKLVILLEGFITRTTPYDNGSTKKVIRTETTGIVAEKKDVPKVDPKVDPKAAPKVDPKPSPKVDPKTAPKAAGRLEAEVPTVDAEQAALIRFIRRQAIKALAEVRYPQFVDTKGVTVRPLHMLAKIAVNDGTYVPNLGPDEFALAVKGLTNLYSFKGVNVDGVLTCVAIGTGNFARRKTGNNNDTTINWKTYAGRLNNSLSEWQKAVANNASMAGQGAKIAPLATLISTQVLTPIEKLTPGGSGSNPPGLEGVQQWVGSKATAPVNVFDDLKPEDVARYIVKPTLSKN